MKWGTIAATLLVGIAAATAFADKPPAIPIGLDAYRMWDHWPDQRIGVRSYMRSTYDRTGGNEGADASHFLYQQADDFNVTLDVEGRGILYFARYNHWHGSPWHYEVDGTDHIVQESSSADPNHPVEGSVFLPEKLFPNPLTWTWSTTKGADLMWVPIAFETHFRMAYSRTHYGTGYYIYKTYVRGAKLSRSFKAWTTKSVPAQDVLDLINRAGTPLFTKADRARTDVKSIAQDTLASSPQGAELFSIRDAGPRTIRALEFIISREEALDFGHVRLRVYWDGRELPSIDAPLSLFFGAGVLYNRDNREYLVKAFPVNIQYKDDAVLLRCYFPMPFFQSARAQLVSDTRKEWKGSCTVVHERFGEKPNQVGYFHATYRDHPEPKAGEDVLLLDTSTAEGGGDWTGSFVGTSFIFSHNAVLNTLEGDPRFFFDDCQTPSYGTGTEEWCGGGDYWGGRNMTLPFAGHPLGAINAKSAKAPEDLIESAYRFLLADSMPFGKRAVIRLEHGGTDNSKEHYETVTYWYGLPGASLVQTDALNIGDAGSEHAHDYTSPDASAPETITSRYEWGVDHVGDKEIYPAHDETGRHTTGTSEFTVALRPENYGVLLRRTLDYSYPNQRAEVYVADASDGEKGDALEWSPAGVWYEAGSNTCYFADPKGETDPPNPVVQTSNRRFRDSEFLIGRALTSGRKAIRVRVVFAPVNRPLLPGMDLPELAWSELRYQAWCFVMPPAPILPKG